jgi:hypothetical protein
MPEYVWAIIIGIALLIFYVMYIRRTTVAMNGNAVAVNRFVADTEGLIGAFEGTTDPNGSFTSRLGSFIGSLGT